MWQVSASPRCLTRLVGYRRRPPAVSVECPGQQVEAADGREVAHDGVVREERGPAVRISRNARRRRLVQRWSRGLPVRHRAQTLVCLPTNSWCGASVGRQRSLTDICFRESDPVQDSLTRMRVLGVWFGTSLGAIAVAGCSSAGTTRAAAQSAGATAVVASASTTSAATGSATTFASPTPSAATGKGNDGSSADGCTTSDLSLQVSGGPKDGSDTVGASIVLTNTSHSTCPTYGYPGVDFYAGATDLHLQTARTSAGGSPATATPRPGWRGQLVLHVPERLGLRRPGRHRPGHPAEPDHHPTRLDRLRRRNHRFEAVQRLRRHRRGRPAAIRVRRPPLTTALNEGSACNAFAVTNTDVQLDHACQRCGCPAGSSAPW